MLSTVGYETLIFTVEDGLATITLNRPEALNALNQQLKDELADVLRALPSNRDEVRAVLLTGAGRAFSAGGDIVQMDPGRGAEVTRQRMTRLLREVLIPLARQEVPVVAAVNGHAHGLGLSLALACDVAFAARSAVLSMAFVRVGLAPDGGASYFLPRVVGVRRAKELMLTGRRLDAEEALALGLVNEVVEDEQLLARARSFARELAQGPTVALGAAKRLIDQSWLSSLEDMAQLEAYAQALAMSSEDHREGIAAFREKRAAKFTGG